MLCKPEEFSALVYHLLLVVLSGIEHSSESSSMKIAFDDCRGYTLNESVG